MTMDRQCVQCGATLPASSRPWRRFCSTRCRVRHWNVENQPRETLPTSPRLHWHVDPNHLLWGDVRLGYWRSQGCPPECSRPLGPAGWSTGVPEGEEGLLPLRTR